MNPDTEDMLEEMAMNWLCDHEKVYGKTVESSNECWATACDLNTVMALVNAAYEAGKASK